jgi:hypothetical protein
MRRAPFLALPMLLAACSGAPEREDAGAAPTVDPVVARALHDPLMSDPDLAARNAANALLGFADDSALPLIPATPEAARAAREAGRLELLEGGAIPPLPAPVAGRGPLPGAGATAGELLATVGAPESCAGALTEGFAWAADLPPPAAIMPHGMTVQAAGADAAPCRVRILRYHTPAPAEDVLQYHFARAARAGLQPLHYAAPGAGIAARGSSGAALSVAVRPSPTGHNAVDLVYRAP